MDSSNQSTRLHLFKLLQELQSSQPNTPVSFSKLAQTLNVSRERIRQLYRELAEEYTLPPVIKRRSEISVSNRHQTSNAATKVNRSKDKVPNLRKINPQARALEEDVRKYNEQGLSAYEIAKKIGRPAITI